MLKKAIIAALFFLVASPSFADESKYKESAICFIGEKVIVFTETATINYGTEFNVFYLPLNKYWGTQGQFCVPVSLGSCLYMKDYQGEFKMFETLKRQFDSAIIIETQR